MLSSLRKKLLLKYVICFSSYFIILSLCYWSTKFCPLSWVSLNTLSTFVNSPCWPFIFFILALNNISSSSVIAIDSTSNFCILIVTPLSFLFRQYDVKITSASVSPFHLYLPLLYTGTVIYVNYIFIRKYTFKFINLVYGVLHTYITQVCFVLTYEKA